MVISADQGEDGESESRELTRVSERYWAVVSIESGRVEQREQASKRAQDS